MIVASTEPRSQKICRVKVKSFPWVATVLSRLRPLGETDALSRLPPRSFRFISARSGSAILKSCLFAHRFIGPITQDLLILEAVRNRTIVQICTFLLKTSSYANLNVALKVVNQPVRSHLRSPSIREWMYPSYITPVSLLVCKEIIPSTHLTHLVLSSLYSKDHRKSWRAAGIAVTGEQDTNRSGFNPQLCTRSGLTQCMPLYFLRSLLGGTNSFHTNINLDTCNAILFQELTPTPIRVRLTYV